MSILIYIDCVPFMIANSYRVLEARSITCRSYSIDIIKMRSCFHDKMMRPY